MDIVCVCTGKMCQVPGKSLHYVEAVVGFTHRQVTVAARVKPVLWLGYRLDDLGLNFYQGQEIFLFSKMSRLALASTHPHI